jgi:hypothetical protein
MAVVSGGRGEKGAEEEGETGEDKGERERASRGLIPWRSFDGGGGHHLVGSTVSALPGSCLLTGEEDDQEVGWAAAGPRRKRKRERGGIGLPAQFGVDLFFSVKPFSLLYFFLKLAT